MVWGGCDFLSCNDEKRFVSDEPGFSNKILSRSLHIGKTLLVSLGSYGALPSIAGNSGKFQIVATEPGLHGPRDLRTVLDGLLQFVAVMSIRVLMSHEEPSLYGGADMLLSCISNCTENYVSLVPAQCSIPCVFLRRGDLAC